MTLFSAWIKGNKTKKAASAEAASFI